MILQVGYGCFLNFDFFQSYTMYPSGNLNYLAHLPSSMGGQGLLQALNAQQQFSAAAAQQQVGKNRNYHLFPAGYCWLD